jgi:hypothetical protein
VPERGVLPTASQAGGPAVHPAPTNFWMRQGHPMVRGPAASQGSAGALAGDPGRRAYSALMMSSTRSFASPKSIWVLSLKNSGFCTPA